MASSIGASHGLRARSTTRDPSVRVRRVREVQHLLGAGDRDVEQPSLLGPLVRRVGVGDRDEPALEPGHEHGVELEALGAVEREQLDGVAGASGASSRRAVSR